MDIDCTSANDVLNYKPNEAPTAISIETLTMESFFTDIYHG